MPTSSGGGGGGAATGVSTGVGGRCRRGGRCRGGCLRGQRRRRLPGPGVRTRPGDLRQGGRRDPADDHDADRRGDDPQHGARPVLVRSTHARDRTPHRSAPHGQLDEPVGELGDAQDRGQPQDRQQPRGQVQVDAGTAEHEHGPVPQVDAVGPFTEPAPRLTAQRTAQQSGGVRHRSDQDGRQQGERQEASPVQGVAELVDPHERRHDPGQRQDAEDVGHTGLEAADRPAALAQPRPCPVPGAPRRPGCGHRGADQQTHGVGVGAEVHPAGVVRYRRRGADGEHGHRDRREQREDGGDLPDPRPPCAHGHHDDEREHQVELLLDGQRPQVLQQRRTAHHLEVRAVGEDLPPVRHVRHGGGDVPAQLRRLAGHRDRDATHRDQQQRQGRQQAACAPRVEAAEREAAGAFHLVEHERGDEVAGQDEEDVDPQEPAAHPRGAEVVDHDPGDGDRADPVEPAQVRHARGGVPAGATGATVVPRARGAGR